MEVLLRRVVKWKGGQREGTRTLACVHAYVVVQRGREEDWRQLIDATRSRCSALLGYQ